MFFEKLDLVQWVKKDDWWFEGCPLVMDKIYRITEVQRFGGGFGYLIHGWWVRPGRYVNLIPNYRFKVGDKVRVALKLVEAEGWDNIWIDRMDGYVGQEYTIAKIKQDRGVYFVEDVDQYAFPPSCLEPV